MRSRSSIVPIEHSVGPMRSMVALGTSMRIRTVGASQRTGAAVHAEPAEQTEVNVADQAVSPVVEEMLSVGLDLA